MALLVLFFTLAVHAFPKTRFDVFQSNCDCEVALVAGSKNEKIKECVQNATVDICEEDGNCKWFACYTSFMPKRLEIPKSCQGGKS